MSSARAKGTALWIFAFFSFLAALNAFNALLLLTLRGSDFIVEFTILDWALGNANATAYLWSSIITTFVLLGSTFFLVFKGLPADPDVLRRLGGMEERLALNTNMLENTQIGFFQHLEKIEKGADEAFRKMNISLEQAKKEMNDALEKHRKSLQDIEKEGKEATGLLKKQVKEVSSLGGRIDRMEEAMLSQIQNPKLTSKSNLEAMKGVNPRLAQELKNMGIITVGQFLTVDPLMIAEKTSEFPEVLTNLQSKAQLLMVPGIDATDAELLVKVGITSRRELSNQDPVQLCRALVGIANTYVDQGKLSESRVPSIDEVWSWIKLSKP